MLRHLALPPAPHRQVFPIQSEGPLTAQGSGFGMLRALSGAWRRKSRYTLRISIQESTDETLIKLEGRVAGPWTAELGRVWVTTAPRLANRKLVLDLRDITYADTGATKLLSEIYAHTHARLITGTVWTQSLAEQIMRGEVQSSNEEL